MGNPSTSLTQWSNGDYGGSTHKEDDLSIITKGNGFGYRPADHGDTIAAATMATGTQFVVTGVIGSRTDVDMIGFTVPAGTLNITVRPLAVGANLDGPDSITEGNTALKTLRYTVSLSAPVNHVTHVRCTIVAGTATDGVEFFAARNDSVLVFAPYQTLAWVTVNVVGDRFVEPDETCRVVLSNPLGVVLGSASSKTVTIVDDDAVSGGSVSTAYRPLAEVFAALALDAQRSNAAERKNTRQ